MNKDQTRNLIIVIGLIIVVFGTVYYFKKNRSAEIPTDVNNQQGLKTEEISSENQSSYTITQGEKNSNTSAQNTEKFNTSMKNAQLAFGKGEYNKSINYYNEALTYIKSDKVYSGLFVTYGAEGDWMKARDAINNAIKLNPLNVDYWNWDISLLDDKTNSTFSDLKKIYEDALSKIDPRLKIDLTTSFARIAEKNNEKLEAIKLWQKAIVIYPAKKDEYQQEIDKLK